MTFAQKLYLRFPAAVQNLACSLEGWRIKRRRYGGNFEEILRQVEARGEWTQEQIEEYRDRRLAWFIREVAAKAPFYQRRFREAGLDPKRVRTLSDLAALPVLTKAEVQEHLRELTPRGLELGRQLVAHTSGTTGGGLAFPVTVEAEREQWAVWWRYRRWHGIDRNTWCGYFGGRLMMPASRVQPPFWRISYPTRQILFSGHQMSPANLAAYVTELRRRRPPWLHGYPSLLALLAGHLLDCGEGLGYTLGWVTTGAENLSCEQLVLLERAFGVRPRQHYGLAEAVANFSECEYGRLHVDEDFAAVEFVPSGDGRTHRVIGTNLSNPATPLVRYDTGDLVTLAEDSECPCGRTGRLVERVDGRAPDFLVLRDGRRFGPANHLFKYMVNIREAQLYQRVPGEITVRIVRGPHYTECDEQRLWQEISQRLGGDNRVEIEYVEAIERGPTGKHLVVVSELKGCTAHVARRGAEGLTTLYAKLPIALQNAACSLEGWRVQGERYGGGFPALLRQVEERTFWSVERILEFRDERLRRFLRESVSRTPYYQRLGVRWEMIGSLEALDCLPVLTKGVVQQRLAEFESEAVEPSRRLIAHTSGTTGAGLRFATTRRAVQEQWAVWWRYRRWHGIDRNTWCGYFGGRPVVPPTQKEPPFWRLNYPGRQILFSGYHMSPANLPAYVEELRRRKPPWLHGYPSLLALLATHLIESGADLGYQVRWVTTGAENLLPQQAELIKRAFGVRPRQHYGLAEAVANFSECELGRLHVDEDFAAVEFAPIGDGRSYRVIGTNFTN